VIRNEKGLKIKRIMAKYEDQKLIRNKFNKKEILLRRILYPLIGILSLTFLGYKIYLTV
jgi:hypothetical protein